MPDPLKQPRVLGDFQGPLAPVTQCDVDGINVVFAEELESWFNAGVACCDECFEDFRSYWPRTAEWDTRFQECSIDIDSFMSGSRLSELYGPAELSTLRHYLECERCGHFIEANLWAFEHCFGSAADFEPEIKALGIVSRRTPFLLLESPFARRVLDAIRSLAATAPAQKIDSSYYRARRAGECATVDLLFFWCSSAQRRRRGAVQSRCAARSLPCGCRGDCAARGYGSRSRLFCCGTSSDCNVEGA